MNKLANFKLLLVVLVSSCAHSPFEPKSIDDSVISMSIGYVYFEGEKYQTVTINGQEWLAENLHITKFSKTGKDIGMVDNEALWSRNRQPAYCSLFFNELNAKTFGYLYNYYAISDSTFVPEGWRVPSNADWESLIEYSSSKYLNASLDFRRNYACYGLKDSDKKWKWEHGGNILGFKVIPNRYISHLGKFDSTTECSCIYSIDEIDNENAWHYHVCEHFQFDNSHKCDGRLIGKAIGCLPDNKYAGYAVRLVRELPPKNMKNNTKQENIE